MGEIECGLSPWKGSEAEYRLGMGFFNKEILGLNGSSGSSTSVSEVRGVSFGGKKFGEECLLKFRFLECEGSDD